MCPVAPATLPVRLMAMEVRLFLVFISCFRFSASPMILTEPSLASRQVSSPPMTKCVMRSLRTLPLLGHLPPFLATKVAYAWPIHCGKNRPKRGADGGSDERAGSKGERLGAGGIKWEVGCSVGLMGRILVVVGCA